MRRVGPFLLLLLLLLAIMAARAIWWQPSTTTASSTPQRVISLSPSITETLFALGAQDALVAVTDYCDYPAQAQDLPSIGSTVNTNLERVLQFQPDLVILLQTQLRLHERLTQIGVPTLIVDNSRLSGIQEGIINIGNIMEKPEKAQQIVNKMHHLVSTIQQRVKAQPAVRTLVAIAHYTNSLQLDQVYIAGQNDFYNDLLELAGGTNVYQNSQLRIPYVTAEGILSMNPDVVIDVFPEEDDHHTDMAKVRQQWEALTPLNAVKQQQIYLLEEDYASTPGPRIVNLLLDFARILHPELDWQDLEPITL